MCLPVFSGSMHISPMEPSGERENQKMMNWLTSHYTLRIHQYRGQTTMTLLPSGQAPNAGVKIFRTYIRKHCTIFHRPINLTVLGYVEHSEPSSIWKHALGQYDQAFRWDFNFENTLYLVDCPNTEVVTKICSVSRYSTTESAITGQPLPTPTGPR